MAATRSRRTHEARTDVKRLGFVLLTLFAALSSTLASAEEPTVRLDYSRGTRAQSCPDAAALRENVAARLGHDPFVELALLELRVRVTRESSAWSAHLELARGAEVLGENTATSDAETCGALMTELEIAMAIALDPVMLRHLPAPEAEPALEPEPAPEPAPAPELEPEASPPPAPEPAVATAVETPAEESEPLRFRVSLAAHLSLFSAPAPAFGVTIGAGLMSTSWSLSLEARADVAAGESRQMGRVESSLLTLSVVPCFHHRAFFGCAVVSGGVFRAEGIGFARPQRISSATWTAGGRLGAEIPIVGPLHLSVGAELTAALSRIGLSTEDGTSLWSTPPVAFRFFLGPSGVF